jgi:hypothetical protein
MEAEKQAKEAREKAEEARKANELEEKAAILSGESSKFGHACVITHVERLAFADC